MDTIVETAAGGSIEVVFEVVVAVVVAAAAVASADAVAAFSLPTSSFSTSCLAFSFLRLLTVVAASAFIS
jgi:hypothetical protein